MPLNPWPPGITSAFWSEGFTEEPDDVLIRTSMDTGPAKVRRRFVNPTKSYSCAILVKDATEYQTLNDFYYITCQGGSDTISLPHPITGAPSVFRFRGPIQWSAAGIAWQASFKLELLP